MSRLCLLLIILVNFLPFSSYANTEVIIREQIEESNEAILELNKEIEKFKADLTVISNSANTLSNQIKQLDLTKRKLDTDIKLTEKQIERDNLDLKILDEEIDITNLSIREKKLLIAENIRDIHDLESGTFIETLLREDTITDMWTVVHNAITLQQAVTKNIRDLETSKTNLVNKQDEIAKKLEDLEFQKSKLSDQKKIVDANVADKNRLLKETKNQESSYNALIKEKEALVAAFEAELREYESQLSYILDPSTLPSRGTAVFSWPTEDVLITQQFGKTVDSVRLYASGSHSGVDFRASVGTPLYAMASGTVVDFGDTDTACRGASFGKWVLIKHDNGLAATYGHLSLVKASKGQRIERGDVVAYSGNTGRSTGPHLHVSVYPNDAVEVSGKPSLACTGKTLVQPRAATNAYLNLLDYTPKTTPLMFK